MTKDNVLFKYLEQISIQINEMKVRHKAYTSEECLFAYRGESKDYMDTSLMPSLFRQKGAVLKENHLFELLSDYGFLDKRQTSKVEQAIESQHFLAISRMLDISFSVLPALYFASKGDEKENGFLYVFCFPEYYSPHSQYIEEFYNAILDNELNIAYSSNFKVISHSFSNDRIKAQVGGFILFPGNEYKPIPEIYYKKIPIYQQDKKEIINALEILFNMKESTLFPEKDKLAENVKEKFRMKPYQKSELTTQGELDVYFKHIEYELAMRLREGGCKNDIIARLLRKEQSDIMFYISQSKLDEKEKVKLSKDTKEKFEFLKMKYDRRK